MSALRVTSTDPRLTRTLRSYGAAEERARWLVRAMGSAEIQRRDAAGAWKTIERFERVAPEGAKR